MQIKLSWERTKGGAAVLADFITIAYLIKDWTMDIWCNPHIRIVLCALVFTIFVFAAEPLLIWSGVAKRGARVTIQILIFALCVWVIYLLPKGNCTISPTPPSVKATDSVSSVHTADSPKTQAPIVADKPATTKKRKELKQDVSESKELAKKESPAAAPMFDLSHATFYGPVAIGPNAKQINDFRNTGGYSPLTFDVFKKVVANLREIKRNHSDMPIIQLTNLSGTIATISAMNELKGILDSAGIAVREVTLGAGSVSNYGNSGVLLNRGSKDSALVADFINAINPFMPGLEDQYGPTSHPEHLFQVYFLGPAEYQPSGQVIVR